MSPEKPASKSGVVPSLSPARVFALEFSAAARLHQRLTIPATADHGALRITYAVGGVERDDAPTILLISAMFGGRWWALYPHHLALSMGVRIVSVDRPGFGGSTRVPLSKRIQIWLETVPILMKKLGVQHVSLVAASAGAIYLLHTLYYLPHILSPKQPYAAFLAPWVHPIHSEVKLLSITCRIPNCILGKHWNKVNKFVIFKVEPALESACNACSAIASVFVPKSKRHKPVNVFSEYYEQESQNKYGMTCGECKELFDFYNICMWAEDTSGANSEAMLCLKKGGKRGSPMWGVCEDLESYVPQLSKMWREREECDKLSKDPELHIDAYFGEVDSMIGKLGQEYFEKCWNKQNCGENIDFRSVTANGTDHDSLGDPMVGVLWDVFDKAKNSLSNS